MISILLVFHRGKNPQNRSLSLDIVQSGKTCETKCKISRKLCIEQTYFLETTCWINLCSISRRIFNLVSWIFSEFWTSFERVCIADAYGRSRTWVTWNRRALSDAPVPKGLIEWAKNLLSIYLYFNCDFSIEVFMASWKW